MALKKPNTPAFENEPTDGAAGAADAAVAERPAASQPAASQSTVQEAKARVEEATPTPEAKAAASTAVARASTSAVATNDAAAKAKAFQKEFQDMKGASDFAFGNYRSFKGNNGTIIESGGDKEDLGRWVQIRLLSWDEHFEVSPGEQSASTKDFVAYSKDGKTIDSVIGEDQRSWVGKAVADYVENLKGEEGFDGAKCRRFIDVAGALMSAENGDDLVGTVIQITLSESSIPSFSRYQQELTDKARCVAMGLPGFKLPDDPFTMFFIRELANKGNNSWTKLKIASALPAKI